MVDRERRVYQRFPAVLKVEYGKDSIGFYSSKSANASINGLFIRTEYPLEKGEKILTSIFIPGRNEPILVECEVIWTRKKKYQ